MHQLLGCREPLREAVKRLLFIVSTLCSALACGDSNSKASCVTGASNLCGCANGLIGSQTCRSDGTYGDCVCVGAAGGSFSAGGTPQFSTGGTPIDSSGGAPPALAGGSTGTMSGMGGYVMAPPPGGPPTINTYEGVVCPPNSDTSCNVGFPCCLTVTLSSSLDARCGAPSCSSSQHSYPCDGPEDCGGSNCCESSGCQTGPCGPNPETTMCHAGSQCPASAPYCCQGGDYYFQCQKSWTPGSGCR